MQPAAQTALVSENMQTAKAQPGKTGPKHGQLLPVKGAFQKALGAKQSPASGQVGKNPLSLLKNLKDAKDPKKLLHEDGLHGTRAAREPANPVPSRLLASALAQAFAQPGRPEKLPGDEESGTAEPASSKHGKKKTVSLAHAVTHADGLTSGVSVIAVDAAKTAVGVTQARPENKAAEEARSAAVSLLANRKAPDVRVHVLDVRKKHAGPASDELAGVLKAQKPAGAEKDAPAPAVNRIITGGDAPVHETRRPSAPAPTSFAGALERLREMAGSELVRAAGIVIRDGGGEIKLTLKPESLGNVRIRMNLVDNAIEGRIIVDNTAVKHVVEGNLSSLMRALTAEGFQTASLSVSVGGQGTDNSRSGEQEEAPRIRRVSAQGAFDANVPGAETMSLGDLLVNLFV